MGEEQLSEEDFIPIIPEEDFNINDESCYIDDSIANFYHLNDKINNVKVFLDNKKVFKQNYENDIELNQSLLNTRLGMLNNIKSVNSYNKKLIMTLIAILFGVIIAITSIVVLNNKNK